jgi:phage FluMu protein Com
MIVNISCSCCGRFIYTVDGKIDSICPSCKSVEQDNYNRDFKKKIARLHLQAFFGDCADELV